MGGMVILRHTLPDGSWHYDWMLDPRRDDAAGPGVADERRLLTFRTRQRPDEAGRDGFEAERIGGHRAAYLTYEGPLSGGRGVVQRVATGWCRIESLTDTQVRVAARFEDGVARQWLGRRRGEGPIWEFRAGDLAAES